MEEHLGSLFKAADSTNIDETLPAESDGAYSCSRGLGGWEDDDGALLEGCGSALRSAGGGGAGALAAGGGPSSARFFRSS